MRCGTCCVAPDISSLEKPPGEACIHLNDDHYCSRYETRPAVCRGYRPDEICRLIAAPTLEERVDNYIELFGLKKGGSAEGLETEPAIQPLAV